MKLPGEKATYYGSRCDKYDSTLHTEVHETCFDEREKLLLQDYSEDKGSGPVVGLPRALLVYDYAPLLIGFLNSLGVRGRLSRRTNKEIVELAVEAAYTDSCFPIKLLHGHAATLKETDYLLFPSSIRLGLKDGQEIKNMPVRVQLLLTLSECTRDWKTVYDTCPGFHRGQSEVIAQF
jgi:hypothetical protein